MPFRYDLIACGMYTLDIAMSGMYFSMVRCLNYSGFAEDVYIVQYCDQIQVAIVSLCLLLLRDLPID